VQKCFRDELRVEKNPNRSNVRSKKQKLSAVRTTALWRHAWTNCKIWYVHGLTGLTAYSSREGRTPLVTLLGSMSRRAVGLQPALLCCVLRLRAMEFRPLNSAYSAAARNTQNRTECTPYRLVLLTALQPATHTVQSVLRTDWFS
jgi:hypothetical protein